LALSLLGALFRILPTRHAGWHFGPDLPYYDTVVVNIIPTYATQLSQFQAGNLDVVTREEFEAIKEMAAKARDENERLSARVAALETKLGAAPKGEGSQSD